MIAVSQIEAARCVIEKAVSVAEKIGNGEYSEHLRLGFSDRESEVNKTLSAVCACFRVTEARELVRGYVYLNDIASPVMVDAIAMVLQPFLESRRDLFLKQDTEGFKICRRDSNDAA